MYFLAALAEIFGCSEPALRLLLTVLLSNIFYRSIKVFGFLDKFLFVGYPLAIVYRKYMLREPPVVQHLYFALIGFALIFWNYGLWKFFEILLIGGLFLLGFDAGHSLFSIFVAFLLCNIPNLRGSLASVVLAYVYFMVKIFLNRARLL